MHYKIDTNRRFQARSAASVTQEVAAADFSSRLDAHTAVLRRGKMSMRQPRVVGPHANDFHIQRPHGMPWKGEGFPSALDYPAMTIARLANPLVAPGGVVLSEDGGFLLSESFGAYWEPQPHISIAMPEPGFFTMKNEIIFNKRLTGTHFYCDSQHIGHFGHFFMDDLSRMWGYLYCRDFLGMRGIKVLTRPMSYEVRQGLNALSIPNEDIVELEEPVICDDLIIATRALERQGYLTPLFAPFCQRLREGVDDPVEVWPSKIFISRRGGNGLRRLVNEDEVEDVFRQRGFAVMHPSEFGSFGRQAVAFGQAEYLAGLSGTNMYCAGFQNKAKGTFVLVSPKLIHYADYHMNQEHSGPLTFYVGDLDENLPGWNPLDVNSSWIISNMADLEGAVDAWLAA